MHAHTEFLIVFRIKTNWDHCLALQTWLSASLMSRTWTLFLPISPTVPTLKRMSPWWVLHSHLTSHHLNCFHVAFMWNPALFLFIQFFSIVTFFTYLEPRCSTPAPYIPCSTSSWLSRWYMRKIVKCEAWAIMEAGCLHLNAELHGLQDSSYTQTEPRAPMYSTAGAGDCNYYGRFTVLLQGCEACRKGHWACRIYLPMLPYVLHACEIYSLWGVQSTKRSNYGLCLYCK